MPMLSVSLSPPIQARLYMEVELMLVHTANAFLMNQFSQGRIAVDSIKKIADGWKNKGRPKVIEFMYDQMTQRELVVINQHDFRFYGERAGDALRVNSMLYNWRQVASLMAIRTFCSADPIVLKLLFDVEQILELLGASAAMLLRFQDIRGVVNRDLKAAKEREKEKNEATANGRERSFQSDSSSRNQISDPYGGMKLVPDTYTE